MALLGQFQQLIASQSRFKQVRGSITTLKLRSSNDISQWHAFRGQSDRVQACGRSELALDLQTRWRVEISVEELFLRPYSFMEGL